MESTQKIFLYNAHAHGVSGEFHRPLKHLIEAQAGVSLPTIGGHGSSRVENFRFNEFVSFKATYSHVSGSWDEEHKSYTTLVTATVEGLNILDVVTADRVVARLSSHHRLDEDEPHIILLGSKFDNFRIAGCKVTVDLDHELFQRLDTFQAVRNEFETNAEFRKMAEDPFQTGQPQKLPPIQGVVLCTFVKQMTTTCPGVKRQGHAFIIPKFGKVYVAEVVAEHRKRTLRMLRLEMGSPLSGTMIAAETVGNGHHFP
jgi:hypothetical protein